jgi:hypothetical protein
MNFEDCNESSEVKDTSEVKQQMTVTSQFLGSAIMTLVFYDFYYSNATVYPNGPDSIHL